MGDDLPWVSVPVHQPHDRQLVYARVKHGIPKKVTFYASPNRRWVGANIVYDFQYFAEWAPFEQAGRPMKGLEA